MSEKKHKLVAEMTMGDLFAGLALAGLLARSDDPNRRGSSFAPPKEETAVAYADRLIAALEKPPKAEEAAEPDNTKPQR